LEARLNWIIFGAGAIGTYIGGNLILHGQNVVFLEQPEATSLLRERGFKLNIFGQELRILHPDVYSSLPDVLALATFDVAIFAIKSYDTQTTLESLSLYSSSLPPVLCLQNGVENEPTLEMILGKNKVIAGTVTSAIRRRAVGDILLERLRGVGVAMGNPLSSQIVGALSDAGLNARLYPSPLSMKWSKMLTNLFTNASSAILDMAPEVILRHPGLYRVEIDQLREAVAVMHGLQIHPVNLPGTPVQAFAWIANYLPPSLSRPLISRVAGKGRGQKMPSFHIDLRSGRSKNEVDYLNGAVVRFGERLHIPTPVNRWLNQTLTNLTQGNLPLDAYTHQPDKYLADIYGAFSGKLV
jgi:2-dehydropantoate 2-reductase